MMEILIYTGTGIFLYLLTEFALKSMERLHGETLPYRNIIFFVIIFMLAMILFPLIQMMYGQPPDPG
jgi:NADH:ubiquinone oxidoreductase subunit 6 (subunit J)